MNKDTLLVKCLGLSNNKKAWSSNPNSNPGFVWTYSKQSRKNGNLHMQRTPPGGLLVPSSKYKPRPALTMLTFPDQTAWGRFIFPSPSCWHMAQMLQECEMLVKVFSETLCSKDGMIINLSFLFEGCSKDALWINKDINMFELQNVHFKTSRGIRCHLRIPTKGE